MKTTQAWGWLTAGVLALGLNGIYQDGGAAWAHRIVDRVADRSGAVLALASGRPDRFMEKAQVVAVRERTQSCKLATAVARIQTRMTRPQIAFAHFEAMSARNEAALAGLEANRLQMESELARVQVVASEIHVPAISVPAINIREISVPKVTVVCPRVRVSVPRPTVRIPAPVVHVRTLGSGSV